MQLVQNETNTNYLNASFIFCNVHAYTKQLVCETDNMAASH